MEHNILTEAKRVLKIEALAIEEGMNKLSDDFIEAVKLIQECSGKLIVAGIGKSGHVGRKLASTFSSTGTSSLFLHAAESSHGDLGVISQEDCVLVISNSGESPELKDLLNFCVRKGNRLIAMTGNLDSTLARASKVCIDIGVSEEACPLKLAPTSSSTATLALGDALAMCVLKEKGFKESDFAEFHPGGSLGKKLLTKVSDLMHAADNIPTVTPGMSMKEVLPMMASFDVRGVLAVVSDEDELVGVVTDGDIRRFLNKSKNPLESSVSEVMSKEPKRILSEEMAVKAIFIMEQFSIQSLFVVGDGLPNKMVGLLHLQDLLKAKIS